MSENVKPSESAPPKKSSGLGADMRASDIGWSEAPRLIMGGMCMGTADMVPGVSGGTLAVALGIYRQLLAAISSVGLPALRALLQGNIRQVLQLVHWRFIFCLAMGIGAAVVVMGKVVKLHELVRTSPQPVYAVFFGLVIASTILLGRKLNRLTPLLALNFAAGAAVGLLIVTLVPTETPNGPAFIFLAGMLAICAMILPGISGSFILLILGKYEFIINSILSLDLLVALPFVLGCAVGIMAFSRILGRALDRFHDPVLAGLTGLLVGSLWRIWPYQHVRMEMVRGKMRAVDANAYWPESFDGSVIGLVVVGLIVVFAMEYLAHFRSSRNSALATPSAPA